MQTIEVPSDRFDSDGFVNALLDFYREHEHLARGWVLRRERSDAEKHGGWRCQKGRDGARAAVRQFAALVLNQNPESLSFREPSEHTMSAYLSGTMPVSPA